MDNLGRPLPGVHISLRNTSGVLVSECVTNSTGYYKLSGAAGGDDTLVAGKNGFRRAVITVLQLEASGGHAAPIVLESEWPLTMSVKAARLRAQNGLSRTGASKYTFTDRDITNLTAGKYTSLNQVMLQMPGGTLDQNQEIHIHGEHIGIQYQVNGILLPLDINIDP